MAINYLPNQTKVTPDGLSLTFHIYEGAETTELEYNPNTDQEEQVTRYRMQTLLETKTVELTKQEIIDLLKAFKKNKLASDVEAGNLEQLWEQWKDNLPAYLSQLTATEGIRRGKQIHNFI